jgi:hypothetical protein
MKTDVWKQRLKAFKESEQPETVLVVAGQGELLRIIVAWMQTAVCRTRRLTKLQDESETQVWAWLWENMQYDRMELLTRVPNATAKTERNLDALIANRVLYPDGTVNAFVGRYLKHRVAGLFLRSMRRRGTA